MDWLTESPARRAIFVLLALIAAFVPISVLRAAPSADLVGVGLGWLLPVIGGALVLASSGTTVAAVVDGLERGQLSSILLAGAAAALVGGSVNVLAGADLLRLPVAAAVILVAARGHLDPGDAARQA